MVGTGGLVAIGALARSSVVPVSSSAGDGGIWGAGAGARVLPAGVQWFSESELAYYAVKPAALVLSFSFTRPRTATDLLQRERKAKRPQTDSSMLERLSSTSRCCRRSSSERCWSSQVG